MSGSLVLRRGALSLRAVSVAQAAARVGVSEKGSRWLGLAWTSAPAMAGGAKSVPPSPAIGRHRRDASNEPLSSPRGGRAARRGAPEVWALLTYGVRAVNPSLPVWQEGPLSCRATYPPTASYAHSILLIAAANTDQFAVALPVSCLVSSERSVSELRAGAAFCVGLRL